MRLVIDLIRAWWVRFARWLPEWYNLLLAAY